MTFPSKTRTFESSNVNDQHSPRRVIAPLVRFRPSGLPPIGRDSCPPANPIEPEALLRAIIEDVLEIIKDDGIQDADTR